MNNLRVIATEAKPPENKINLTTNNLTIAENSASVEALETLLEKTIIISPHLIIFNHNATDLNWGVNKKVKEVEKLSLSNHKTNLPLRQQNIQQNNSLTQQQAILEILETRFEQLPNPISEQVSQVKNPLLLKQLHQIAEVTSSLETFQQILPSMTVNSEQITIIATDEIAIDKQKKIKRTAEALQKLENSFNPEQAIVLISQQTSETSETNTTDSNQRKAWEHEGRPLHRDSSQPGQSLAEQATDPSAILGQLQLQNIFIPSTYDADGYANTFVIQPVIPFKPTGFFPASVSRITWSAIVTTPERDTPIPNVTIPGTTNIGDITWLHAWIIPVTKDLRIGAGPTAIFPSAGSDRTGSGKWQLGPNFLVIYSGIPHLTLGFLLEQTFSFAGDSDRPALAPLRGQPIIVYHLPKGWYFGWGDELMLLHDFRTGDFDLPLNIRVGKVFKIGDQAINMFIQPSYTPKGFQSGGQTEWSVKLNATFILPGLLF